MATLTTEGAVTDFSTRMWQDPRICGRVLNLAAEAKIRSRNLGSRVGEAALGAGPIRRGSGGSSWGGGGGRAVRRLLSPALDANKVEKGVAAGSARPGGVAGADALEADEARDQGAAPGGGGEERSDLREIRRGPS